MTGFKNLSLLQVLEDSSFSTVAKDLHLFCDYGGLIKSLKARDWNELSTEVVPPPLPVFFSFTAQTPENNSSGQIIDQWS